MRFCSILLLLCFFGLTAQAQIQEASREPGIYFRIQLTFSKTPLKMSRFRGVENVMLERSPSGAYRYLAGGFRYHEAANAYQIELYEEGFKDAYIVAYNNGKRLPVDEARDIIES